MWTLPGNSTQIIFLYCSIYSFKQSRTVQKLGKMSLGSKFRSHCPKNYNFLLTNYYHSIPQNKPTSSPAEIFYNHLVNPETDNIERSLSSVDSKIDSDCVTKVLRRCYPQNSLLGLRFFIWAGLQSTASGYRHSNYMYAKACNLLGICRNPQIVFHVIEAYGTEAGGRGVRVSLLSVNTFKILLRLCREAQLADLALWVMRKMAEFDLRADTTVYNVVISLFCEKHQMDVAEELMKEMSGNNLYPDIITYVTMIKGLCNVGRIEAANEFVSAMREHGCVPNHVVYSALVDGVCKSGEMEKALQLLGQMETDGGECSPNVVTYTSVIHRFCENGQLMEALQLLSRMEGYGCSPNRVTVSILISALCGEDRVEEAYKLIDKVVVKHNVSYGDCYSSLLTSLVRLKRTRESKELFRKMLSVGIKPDSLACNLLIKELCIEGKMLEGFSLLDEIENARVLTSIDSDVYSFLLAGLLKKSHMLEAAKLTKLMIRKGIPLVQ